MCPMHLMACVSGIGGPLLEELMRLAGSREDVLLYWTFGEGCP